MIDYEKEYERDFKAYVKENHLLALDNYLTSTEINTYEHEMDNSFIDCSFGATVNNIERSEYNFIGVGEAPYPHHDWHYAIVLENKETFEKYWCHIPAYLIENWNEEKGKYQ